MPSVAVGKESVAAAGRTMKRIELSRMPARSRISGGSCLCVAGGGG